MTPPGHEYWELFLASVGTVEGCRRVGIERGPGTGGAPLYRDDLEPRHVTIDEQSAIVGEVCNLQCVREASFSW